MPRTTTAEILDLIRFVAKHPYMCAQTPEEASALVAGLAAVALAENSDRTLQIALRDVGRVLVPRAVTDVPNWENVGVHLCDECADPRRTSFEAFTRHTAAFLKVLALEGVGSISGNG